MTSTLAELERRGWLSTIDVEIADTVARIGNDRDPLVSLAIALASRQVRHGHVCLDIPRLVAGDLSMESPEDTEPLTLPTAVAWRRALQKSRLVRSAEAETTAPLVLDARGRLYFDRYFEHQSKLAAHIRARATRPRAAASPADVDRVFEASADPSQKLVVTRVLERDLVVVTGGPGTGKTTTVVQILAALAERAIREGRKPPDAHLLAPTGKAKARLGEAVKRALGSLPCSDEARRAIPREATTIHRAIGIGEIGATRPRRHVGDPLRGDIFVVDEASMVDLPLMRRFFDAIPPDARVVLLGDENQLSSVEVGSVLGDLCQAESAALGASIVRLTRAHRYAEDSGIAALADAIRDGRADAAIDVLGSGRDDVTFVETTTDERALAAIRRRAVEGFAPLVTATRETCLAALDQFRVLAPHRGGTLGVDALNAAIERWVESPDGSERRMIRPILVTRNDYALDLFNGDVGAVVQDGAREVAVFARAEGTRTIAIERLPPHETVYATSVHKSQGSEVEHVLVVLPTMGSRVVTRELLYTAVTRAKRSVTIVASSASLARAIDRRVERASGLRDALSTRRASDDRQQKLPF